MYPKNKYRADAPVRADGHLHHVRVDDPVAEDELGDGWHDTPNDARAALDTPALEDVATEDAPAKPPTRAELRAARAASKA
jgi:hypothetical protein